MIKKNEPVKIISLEVENVKRVQAISLTPAESGLTVIGGDNGQGKSSILDAIMSALGGESKLPTQSLREGAQKGGVTIELSNGLTVTRTFTEKGSYLKVSGQTGGGGQSLLNEFVNTFALDLSTFLNASDKERSKILLGLVGLDLRPLEERYKKIYADREAVGRLATRAKEHAADMPFDEAAGLQLLTPSEIMTELQRKLAVNARHANLRAEAGKVTQACEAADMRHQAKVRRVKELKAALAEAVSDEILALDDLATARRDMIAAQSSADGLKDEDVTTLKAKLSEIDETNARVRKNLEREKALAEAEAYKTEYQGLTSQLDDIKNEKEGLLAATKMPLPNLGVEEGALTYEGRPWDGLSHSAQLRVAAAICRAIQPKQGFVLLDKLEAMDLTTLKEFGTWLEGEGLQAIATRVSKGGECSIIISDGMVEGTKTKSAIKFD